MLNLLAQNAGGKAGSGTTINVSPQGVGDIQNITIGGIISFFVTALLIIAGLVFFFMLVIGGLRWITSGGDKSATEGARNQITAALIGLVIVFSAWAIAQLLANVFGINIFSFTLPTISSLSQ